MADSLVLLIVKLIRSLLISLLVVLATCWPDLLFGIFVGYYRVRYVVFVWIFAE